jgi:hypothetical protein
MKPPEQILVIKLVLALVTSGGFHCPLADNAFETWALGFAFRTLEDVERSPGSESSSPG